MRGVRWQEAASGERCRGTWTSGVAGDETKWCVAVLLPPHWRDPEVAPAVMHELDESQLAAVMWEGGPLLVEAGPGTGKTRTLVRRIQRKLEENESPASFLALTFSRKASEEMRERIAGMNPDASIEMWVGTFHQFGLELVTKWPLRFGRTSDVRPLDQTGQLELLEANLEKLPLKHFQNLYEPAYELVPVLRVISRCKDELISPDQYETDAKAFKRNARTEEEHEDADRALEVAAIYRIYEEELKRADAVDFGDLVVMASELVNNHPEVQTYVAGFKHILVDEFQDVNFASAELLRGLAKTGTDVWVVADPRQSIYRFRGAEPSNVAKFSRALSVASGRLRRIIIVRTRRSRKAFARFSGAMLAVGGMAATWTPDARCWQPRSRSLHHRHFSAEGEAIPTQNRGIAEGGNTLCRTSDPCSLAPDAGSYYRNSGTTWRTSTLFG